MMCGFPVILIIRDVVSVLTFRSRDRLLMYMYLRIVISRTKCSMSQSPFGLGTVSLGSFVSVSVQKVSACCPRFRGISSRHDVLCVRTTLQY